MRAALSCSEVVITVDFESTILGSNPSERTTFLSPQVFAHFCLCPQVWHPTFLLLCCQLPCSVHWQTFFQRGGSIKGCDFVIWIGNRIENFWASVRRIARFRCSVATLNQPIGWAHRINTNPLPLYNNDLTTSYYASLCRSIWV